VFIKPMVDTPFWNSTSMLNVSRQHS